MTSSYLAPFRRSSSVAAVLERIMGVLGRAGDGLNWSDQIRCVTKGTLKLGVQEGSLVL